MELNEDRVDKWYLNLLQIELTNTTVGWLTSCFWCVTVYMLTLCVFKRCLKLLCNYYVLFWSQKLLFVEKIVADTALIVVGLVCCAAYNICNATDNPKSRQSDTFPHLKTNWNEMYTLNDNLWKWLDECVNDECGKFWKRKMICYYLQVGKLITNENSVGMLANY